MLFEGDTDPTPAEGMVTVGRFGSPIEAQMAKGMLESAGIQCQLVGENVNAMMAGVLRVRLQVLDGDAAAARELMAEASDDPQSDGNA